MDKKMDMEYINQNYNSTKVNINKIKNMVMVHTKQKQLQ